MSLKADCCLSIEVRARARPTLAARQRVALPQALIGCRPTNVQLIVWMNSPGILYVMRFTRCQAHLHLPRGPRSRRCMIHGLLYADAHVRVGACVKPGYINERQISSMTTGPALKPIATDCSDVLFCCFSTLSKCNFFIPRLSQIMAGPSVDTVT
jgi:hypothetical protein